MVLSADHECEEFGLKFQDHCRFVLIFFEKCQYFAVFEGECVCLNVF